MWTWYLLSWKPLSRLKLDICFVARSMVSLFHVLETQSARFLLLVDLSYLVFAANLSLSLFSLDYCVSFTMYISHLIRLVCLHSFPGIGFTIIISLVSYFVFHFWLSQWLMFLISKPIPLKEWASMSPSTVRAQFCKLALADQIWACYVYLFISPFWQSLRNNFVLFAKYNYWNYLVSMSAGERYRHS